jgi:hypothetical protein
MTRIIYLLLLAAGLLGCQALPPDTSAGAEPRCRREDVTGSNISRCSTSAPATDEERRAAREAVEGMREDQMRRHMPRPPGPPGSSK